MSIYSSGPSDHISNFADSAQFLRSMSDIPVPVDQSPQDQSGLSQLRSTARPEEAKGTDLIQRGISALFTKGQELTGSGISSLAVPDGMSGNALRFYSGGGTDSTSDDGVGTSETESAGATSGGESMGDGGGSGDYSYSGNEYGPTTQAAVDALEQSYGGYDDGIGTDEIEAAAKMMGYAPSFGGEGYTPNNPSQPVGVYGQPFQEGLLGRVVNGIAGLFGLSIAQNPHTNQYMTDLNPVSAIGSLLGQAPLAQLVNFGLRQMDIDPTINLVTTTTPAEDPNAVSNTANANKSEDNSDPAADASSGGDGIYDWLSGGDSFAYNTTVSDPYPDTFLSAIDSPKSNISYKGIARNPYDALTQEEIWNFARSGGLENTPYYQQVMSPYTGSNMTTIMAASGGGLSELTYPARNAVFEGMVSGGEMVCLIRYRSLSRVSSLHSCRVMSMSFLPILCPSLVTALPGQVRTCWISL
jgi:hypothetical protein